MISTGSHNLHFVHVVSPKCGMAGWRVNCSDSSICQPHSSLIKALHREVEGVGHPLRTTATPSSSNPSLLWMMQPAVAAEGLHILIGGHFEKKRVCTSRMPRHIDRQNRNLNRQNGTWPKCCWFWRPAKPPFAINHRRTLKKKKRKKEEEVQKKK